MFKIYACSLVKSLKVNTSLVISIQMHLACFSSFRFIDREKSLLKWTIFLFDLWKSIKGKLPDREVILYACSPLEKLG